jgi:hypothetical protein
LKSIPESSGPLLRDGVLKADAPDDLNLDGDPIVVSPPIAEFFNIDFCFDWIIILLFYTLPGDLGFIFFWLLFGVIAYYELCIPTV